MTDCPSCGKDLWATLWLEAYGELRSGEITESAYVPVDVVCENCLAEHHVMLEIQIELLGATFEKPQSAEQGAAPDAVRQHDEHPEWNTYIRYAARAYG